MSLEFLRWREWERGVIGVEGEETLRVGSRSVSNVSSISVAGALLKMLNP